MSEGRERYGALGLHMTLDVCTDFGPKGLHVRATAINAVAEHTLISFSKYRAGLGAIVTKLFERMRSSFECNVPVRVKTLQWCSSSGHSSRA